MIARIAWYLAILMVAAVTIAVQLDRQSAITPHFADDVPQTLRGFAQTQMAARALKDGNAANALTEAKRLVARRPVPAETLRLLSQAQVASGDANAAALTIQIAAQRGWRDPVAQEALLRFAVAAGDEKEAARRYVALFLQNRTRDELLIEFGDRLFASPDSAASQTLIEVLGGSERWPTTFLSRGARVLPPETFAIIVTRASDSGTQFDCKVLRDTRQRIASRSSIAESRIEKLIQSRC